MQWLFPLLLKKNINNRIRRINYANSQRIWDIHQEFKDKIIKSRIILPFYIFISLILHNPYPMYYFKLALKIQGRIEEFDHIATMHTK